MSKIFSILVLILTLAAAAASASAQTSDAAKSTAATADENAIREIVKRIEAGWNAKSGRDFAAPFAPDADYVVVNGMYIKGREMIEKGHTQIFATVYRDSRNAATIKSVRFLRPDVAIAHVEWNLVFRQDGREIKSAALNTLLLTREKGLWSVAAFHNTPIQSPAATSSAAAANR